MGAYESSNKKRSRARERQAARKRRRSAMATLRETGLPDRVENLSVPGVSADWKRRLRLLVGDLWWHSVRSPRVIGGLAVILVVLFGLFYASYAFSGKIFPGVWVLDIYVGDMTPDEAASTLLAEWNGTARIELYADGEVVRTVPAVDLGLFLKADETVAMAQAVGMAGIPLGYGVAPQVEVDFNTVQTYLLDLVPAVDVVPYSAGYEWQEDRLMPVDGREGRSLDVALTLEAVIQDPVGIAQRRRLDLLMTTLRPQVVDASPYLEQADLLARQPFQLTGYDPFTDEYVPWTTTREEFTSWLAAGQSGLILREDTFNAFIDALNTRLSAEGDGRFVDPAEIAEGVQAAIRAQEHFTLVRMRYHPEIYTVEAGDTSFRIARKMGSPRFLIVEANPGRDLGSLFVGDEIKLPSRDVVLSKPVVPQKRIIVNLNNQTMAAFENGQLVFQWAVSSGIETAPTSPGIFQILTHNETARGSSFALCNDEGLNCGQWVMHWFMGIYEVTPGLMNGFHGKVELPNGGLLGDGAVGRPYTFGCLMARDGDAKSLYDWAEDGTIVEVISSEFEPRSELARQALAQNIV